MEDAVPYFVHSDMSGDTATPSNHMCVQQTEISQHIRAHNGAFWVI